MKGPVIIIYGLPFVRGGDDIMVPTVEADEFRQKIRQAFAGTAYADTVTVFLVASEGDNRSGPEKVCVLVCYDRYTDKIAALDALYDLLGETKVAATIVATEATVVLPGERA